MRTNAKDAKAHGVLAVGSSYLKRRRRVRTAATAILLTITAIGCQTSGGTSALFISETKYPLLF
jgi:hypothetical protein